MKAKLFYIMISLFLTSCQFFLPNSNNANTQPSVKYTAKKDFWRIESNIRNWDLSARLVKVESFNVSEDGLSTQWIYYFRSPFKTTILMADSNGLLNETPEVFFFSDFEANLDWNIDSDTAIKTAKDNGLKVFPIKNFYLEQKAINPEWNIISEQGTFRVDAKTGTFINN